MLEKSHTAGQQGLTAMGGGGSKQPHYWTQVHTQWRLGQSVRRPCVLHDMTVRKEEASERRRYATNPPVGQKVPCTSQHSLQP